MRSAVPPSEGPPAGKRLVMGLELGLGLGSGLGLGLGLRLGLGLGLGLGLWLGLGSASTPPAAGSENCCALSDTRRLALHAAGAAGVMQRSSVVSVASR
eukprot:scaffold113192_cov46-Phaeocystis_antarctica.AAC.3